VYSDDSLDWKDYDANTIISNVCNHKALGNGSIILCHNGAKHTAEALDEMLINLENQGYEIVPISELIIREDFHMDVTGKQIED
jgi:peptidoglycan/xylan/chitin deacetylase (PgdA/CDA1 family)